MKKVIVVFVLFVGVVCVGLCIPKKEYNYDYLRLHIRANSNSEIDQNVKYEIKNVVVEFLSPYLCNVESKEKAVEIVNKSSEMLNVKCNKLLRTKGFNYSTNIKIANEFFPTRTYNNTTLESGYYDAVIIELGQAEGDNWWCVMYPPLCFVNKNENNMQINYKSRICEWFKKVF